MPTRFPPMGARSPNAGCSRSKVRARARSKAKPCSTCCSPLRRHVRRTKFTGMTRTALLQGASISVSEFRCSAAPGDKPFVEQWASHSISYVRKGSFGCHSRGRFFELVAGSILVGHPGDEFMCTHDHVCGDECLSFFVNPELVEMIGDRTDVWQIGAVPPLPELMVLGELAQASADGRSDIGLDEIGQAFVSRFVKIVAGRPPKSVAAPARDRLRAVETALWIDAHSHQQIDVEQAAGQAGISP